MVGHTMTTTMSHTVATMTDQTVTTLIGHTMTTETNHTITTTTLVILRQQSPISESCLQAEAALLRSQLTKSPAQCQTNGQAEG